MQRRKALAARRPLGHVSRLPKPSKVPLLLRSPVPSPATPRHAGLGFNLGRRPSSPCGWGHRHRIQGPAAEASGESNISVAPQCETCVSGQRSQRHLGAVHQRAPCCSWWPELRVPLRRGTHKRQVRMYTRMWTPFVTRDAPVVNASHFPPRPASGQRPGADQQCAGRGGPV